MRVKLLFLFLVLLAFTGRQALAVSVTVSNGMVVQTYIGTTTPSDTASMGRIVLDGDVTDFITSMETGKILGKVTCSNMAKTSFAGITLTNINGTKNGTMTRITGDPEATYQCTLNSAPDNMPVYYIVRQNNADFSADVSFAFEDDGSVDPQYAIKRYFAATPGWEDYGTGSAASPILATAVPFHFSATGGANNVVIGVHYGGLPRIYAKAFLEGNWDIVSAAQTTPVYKMYWYQDFQNVLATQLTDPYGVLTTPISQLPTLQNHIIDWVNVRLRSTVNGAYVANAVGFIDEFGYVYDVDGDAGIPVNVAPGSYWIVLSHHNHLPVQSNEVVDTESLTGYGTGDNYWDFTQLSNCYHNPGLLEPAERHLYKLGGSGVVPIEPPIYGLFGGNTDDEGGNWWEYTDRLAVIIAGEDRNSPQNESGQLQHYTRADVNLNGYVISGEDRNLPQNNSGIATNVPLVSP
ncbi:hypothetical protein JXO59_11125 [candidate division KSB1 bacterium]|nr:hypothetical protein [candidate division KSB1 bacterium]